MLADIFMDLLYIVGIAFLGIIFVAILISAINEIKLNKTKNDMLKTFRNTTLKAFEEELDKNLNSIKKDKEK